MIVDSLTELIGRTPMLRLNRLTAGLDAEILAKLEMFNPYSLKDRPALYLIEDFTRDPERLRAAARFVESVRWVGGEPGDTFLPSHPLEETLLHPTDSFALRDQPDLVDAVIDKVSDIIYAVVEDLMDEPHVGGIFMGDDLGYASGTMVSPRVLRDRFLPHTSLQRALGLERARADELAAEIRELAVETYRAIATYPPEFVWLGFDALGGAPVGAFGFDLDLDEVSIT